ncbi:hypothetical protein D3C71_1221860 [compost metagenome]
MIRQPENLLGKTDVHQQHTGRHIGLHLQRRQCHARQVQWPVTFAQAQCLQGLQRYPGTARRAEKADHLLDRQGLPRHRRTRRQRHRLDAHQLQALFFMPLERDPPLQHW